MDEDEKEVGAALLDIGGGTTDLVIIQDNIVRHTAVIPFGGNSITEDVKQGCGVSSKTARPRCGARSISCSPTPMGAQAA